MYGVSYSFDGGRNLSEITAESMNEMSELVASRDRELRSAGVLPTEMSLGELVHQYYSLFVAEMKNNGLRAGFTLVRDKTRLLLRYLRGAGESGSSKNNEATDASSDAELLEIQKFRDSVAGETTRPVRVLDLNYYMFCPPVSGGMLRILSPLVKMESDNGVRFSVLFTTYSKDYAKECEAYLNQVPCIEFSKGVVSYKYKSPQGKIPDGIPKDVWLSVSKELVDYLQKLLSRIEYDIIQVEHSQMAWIVPFLRRYSPKSKIVLDAHNVEYRIYETWLPYSRADEVQEIEQTYDLLKRWEEKVWPWFDYAFSVSPSEKKILEDNGISKTYLVPTGGGIDPDKYLVEDGHPRQMDILYIGSMNWYPNTHGLSWFIEEVLPIIERKRPGTNVNLVGAGAPSDDFLSIIKDHPDIKYWGFQKDDGEFFRNSKVFIVPLWIGAGARVKVITAWASKIPVVSTVFGAEGALTRNGENILMYDQPQEFAEAILKVLDDPQYSKRITDDAYDTLLENYTTLHCIELLEAAYSDMAGSSRLS